MAVVYLVLSQHQALPPIGVIAGFTLFALLTLTMAFPAPNFGYLSLERVSQIATILIFGPVTAIIANSLAYLVWPFLSFYQEDFSLFRAVVRSLHNAGMIVFMILIAGSIYHLLGGRAPLNSLSGATIGALAAMAIVMQVANDIFMGVLAKLQGGSFRAAFTAFGDLIELATVPLAVFTAIVFNKLPLGSFALFLIVLILLALLMRRFALNRTELETRIEQMTAINKLAQAVGASIDVNELTELAFAQCRKLLDFSSFYLVLYDEERDELDFCLHHNAAGRMPRRRRPAGEGLIGWLIANNQAVLIEDWSKDRSELTRRSIIVGEPPASWIGVPVTYRGRVLGAISVQNFVPRTFNKGDLDLMVTFAGQVGAAITNAKLFAELQGYKHELEHKVAERTEALVNQADELRRMSDSLRETNEVKERLLTELQRKTEELDRQSKEDSLTGLYNRRYMDARLASELQRAQRFGRSVAVAMADIDYFKRINDRCSHAVGDEVLRITAQILRRACRAIDIISRYGGEEFVICFPETDVDNAMIVCEKIRRAMATYGWEFVHPGLKVTISIGVAGGSSCYDQEELQKSADQKLYEAKDLGRDRVCA